MPNSQNVDVRRSKKAKKTRKSRDSAGDGDVDGGTEDRGDDGASRRGQFRSRWAEEGSIGSDQMTMSWSSTTREFEASSDWLRRRSGSSFKAEIFVNVRDAAVDGGGLSSFVGGCSHHASSSSSATLGSFENSEG